jgi:hypothetical protein
MIFAVNDIVQPKRGFEETVVPGMVWAEVPSGKVRKVVQWDDGQLLFVGDDERPFFSGCFNKVSQEAT